jgi:hypothetical protein
MALKPGGRLLLLDLDGVVIFEVGPPHAEKAEIVLLHDLTHLLRILALPVVVLTHRSRREATHILQAAGLTTLVTAVMAAEDIFRASLASRRPWLLLRHGLKKSWILPNVEKRHGVARRDIIFIDDRRDNLDDLLSHGVGLTLHAASGISEDGLKIISFDFESAIQLITRWDGEPAKDILPLRPREIDIGAWSRTGLDTRRQAKHLFNHLRRCGSLARGLLQ